jgi:hypothetical protein
MSAGHSFGFLLPICHSGARRNLYVDGIPAFAGMTEEKRHSFALGENGYAVSGVVRKKRRVAWTQALAEVPVVVVRL